MSSVVEAEALALSETVDICGWMDGLRSLGRWDGHQEKLAGVAICTHSLGAPVKCNNRCKLEIKLNFRNKHTIKM